MRKWIQLILFLLVLVLIVQPMATIRMDKAFVAAPEVTLQPTAVASLPQGDVVIVTDAPTSEPTAVPTATPEPTVEPTATPEPTAVPELPSAIPVNTGARDAEGDTTIAQIQQRLIDLNYLFGAADGIFGASSTEAIRAFQTANGLPEYGIVDEETYYALYSDNVIAAPEPTPTPLSRGASGEEVTALQHKLSVWGFLPFEPDGSYGEGTTNGVKNFQQYMHDFGATLATEVAPTLLPEGVTPSPEPTPEPTPVPTPTPVITAEPPVTPVPSLPANLPITLGSRDSATDASVSRVQQRLVDLGYLSDVVDGAFGANSAAAVSAFQRTHGLSETGVVDADTYYAILSYAAVVVTPTPYVEPTPTPYVPDGIVDDELLAYVKNGHFDVYRQDVQVGDQNDEAFRVQRRLACLDYMYTSACDGAFGEVSALALKYFQKLNRLPETGVADEATQKALFSETALRSSHIVYPYRIVVDVSDQRTYVYQWTGDGYTADPVQTFVCSTGTTKNPTPLGTYSADGKATQDQWYYFKDFKCYAQYAYRIFGGILFHSITYDQPKESTIHRGALNNLGKRASHGCIRLTVENAKWIYDNCPAGTTVTIQE